MNGKPCKPCQCRDCKAVRTKMARDLANAATEAIKSAQALADAARALIAQNDK